MPKAIRDKFELKRHQREEELKKHKVKYFTDNNDLLDYIKANGKKYDEIHTSYGETEIQNYCLTCSKEEISIVVMNCGHAYHCDNCFDPNKKTCAVCKANISFIVRTQQ